MRLLLRILFIFLLTRVNLADNSEENSLEDGDSSEERCSLMVCRAGRECRVQNGVASCVCLASCPDHFVPVCGSNNKSYDNYCELHRDACLSGIHISLKHKGYCSQPKKTKSSTSSKNKKSSKKNEDDSLLEPVVCFQWERDVLRRQILSYFRQHITDQSWYRPGLKNNEKLWGRFYMCDLSKDNFLDANEFLSCVKEVNFSLRSSLSNNDLVKALCVDAIVDAGDSNSDWRLDFAEFKKLMDSSFHPKEKMCSLEGKKYEDGSQTKVDCNDCICACGSWVCTSKTCDQINEIDDNEDDDLVDDEDISEDEDEEDDDDTDDAGKLKTKILEIEENDTSDDPDEDDKENDDDEEDDDDTIDEEAVKNKKKKEKKKHLF